MINLLVIRVMSLSNMMRTVTLFFIIGVIAGCDTSVDPLDEKKGQYSIYGALNIYEDTNFVRVRDMNNSLTESETRDLNIHVTMENIEMGLSEVLEDSIVYFDGVYTHNFETTLDIAPDTRYIITVEDSVGNTVRDTASTPKIVDTNVDPTGKDCETDIVMSFMPISGSIDISLGIYYEGSPEFFTRERSSSEGFEQVNIRRTPADIIIDALGENFADDPEGNIRCHDLSSNQVIVRYTVYGPEFFKDDASRGSDIPGGTRRFGGYYQDQFTFEIDTTDIYDDT